MHLSVLLKPAIDALLVKPGGIYVDATAGGGGHTQAILDQGGQVIAIDQDDEAIVRLEEKFQHQPITLIHDSFANLDAILWQRQVSGIDGILFDLGISSFQLDTPERGFSFQHDAPLDMRMNRSQTVTAQELVNRLSQKELYAIFTNYAQEERAWAIAQAIVSARQLTPITTTKQLASVIEKVKSRRGGKIHPATKTFQALRIAVNHELEIIEQALQTAARVLKSHGRLVVISFHEGEDRIVKKFIKKAAEEGSLEAVTKKPVKPDQIEVDSNPRSRSARMRVAEKL